MIAGDTQPIPTTPVPEEEVKTMGFTILQCKSCRSIVGDTSSLQIFNKKTSVMTLQKKSDNVVIDGELETSKGEFDYGSTFNNLHCKTCNELIGRTYRTTTSELDHIRGRFSFNLGSLIIFEIPEMEQPAAQIGNDQISSGKSVVDQVEITKLQKFVLALYDRLEQLESENDSMKSEMISISNKLEISEETLKRSGSGFPNYSSSQKQVKVRSKERVKVPSVASEIVLDPIKSIAASISSAEFNNKPTIEKERILSAMDDNTAMETISWAILNSGRITQLQKEIDF